MRRHSLPNRVAEGQLLFPTCAALATLLWWFPVDSLDWHHIGGWVLCMLTSYVLTETNNANQLIRIRTRMVAAVWLILMATIGSLHPMQHGTLAAFSLAVSHYMLFRTYQRREPTADTFHALLFASIASLFVPALVVLLPCYLWYLLVFMRVMSLRVLSAWLIGVVLPYLFVGAYCVAVEDFAFLVDHWHSLTTLGPTLLSDASCFTLEQKVVLGSVSVVALWSAIHYLHNYYNDKIRVRMLLYILVFQFVVIEFTICLQPQWMASLLAPLIVVASPLVAHYFALTPSRFASILYLLSLVVLVAQAVLTLF